MGDQTLNLADARDALQSASEGMRLDPGEADLLGPVADNAVFRLPGGLVARVATSAALPRARREVRVGRWLAGQGVPAVRPVDSIDQPVVVADHVVTFWHEVRGAVTASTAELGALLRQLHTLPRPSDFELWPLDPFVRLTEHLRAAEDQLDPADREFLEGRLHDLRADHAKVSADLRLCVIHGDANRKNAIRSDEGPAVLLDFERFSLGPREWDLVVPAVYRRLGWYSPSEYDAFVSAYGWDITEWDGFDVYAALREFRMTAWLLGRLAREPRLRNEAQSRIASLRDPGAKRNWTPGT